LGLVDHLKGKKVCFDTAPFIYYIESHDKYKDLISPVFQEIDAEEIEAFTSTITLLEVLIHPLRTGNKLLAEQYREILLHSTGLKTYEISHESAELAAQLRAKYTIKAPDAIQIVVGISMKAICF